jgi:DNA-binding transcriptional regulator LsrR (DeoR family)
VLSSCSELSNSSAFSELLGTRESQALDEGGAVGDFAYSFIDDAGRPVEIETTAPSFLLGYHKLKELSQRPDARIILAAGGAQKQRIIHRVLEAGLANVLVTDIQTGGHLLERH